MRPGGASAALNELQHKGPDMFTNHKTFGMDTEEDRLLLLAMCAAGKRIDPKRGLYYKQLIDGINALSALREQFDTLCAKATIDGKLDDDILSALCDAFTTRVQKILVNDLNFETPPVMWVTMHPKPILPIPGPKAGFRFYSCGD